MKDHSNNLPYLSEVQIDGEDFLKITNVDVMRPFFMSIVSDSDHWMFISSNGGLTAGRKNAEYALFPYYTDDKITELAEITGSKSLFQIRKNAKNHLWEPFSIRQQDQFNVTRNLYKSTYGNKIIFEEMNEDLEVSFMYQWNSSERFGFAKKSTLKNLSDSKIQISILDGLQNILPSGVSNNLQNQRSNLVDAYKRSEIDSSSGLGIYALSAIIVDKAEPSEALKANVAWSTGIDIDLHLCSSNQLDNFRKNIPLQAETDVKAEKGAYFINAKIDLDQNSRQEWMIIADVHLDHSDIFELINSIKYDAHLKNIINTDIEKGTKNLVQMIAAADGLQCTSDSLNDIRHSANTLFNIMRGGIFDDNYIVEKADFSKYLSQANLSVFKTSKQLIQNLPDRFTVFKLKEAINNVDDSNFTRLCMEYMPLKFSRRHGDPSRPWNKFSINIRSETDGSKILDYEGNWRDIFQNWEALAHSYPEFAESMLHKFLNATTFDGYNPYRITKGGIDWETIEPDDPWSYIGYWGDHQIIYLLKFLEFIEGHNPGALESYFQKEIFVYANVPYKIKSYHDILNNPKDTIDFDSTLDRDVRKQMGILGADGALLRDKNDKIVHINFIEKILATVLAKISNFIPEGGIWMNTQRPEWNDANNALVGNGVSMVTLYYLRRFLKFVKYILTNSKLESVQITNELLHYFEQLSDTLETQRHLLDSSFSDEKRKLILDGLGQAASDYRNKIYLEKIGDKKSSISISNLIGFIKTSLEYLEHSIDANLRNDQLYHAYNLMTVKNEKEVSIEYLNEMLEGQVAVLSSEYLSSRQALQLLDHLRESALFRNDQFSYLLYPNKNLPGFLQKNTIPYDSIKGSMLLSKMLDDKDTRIIKMDVNEAYHFNGNFKNAIDLDIALEALLNSKYATHVVEERQLVLQIFEEVFNHKAFTGRSGTFYGYEGLGSIYWHMVSKLQLAVLECCHQAIAKNEDEELIRRLFDHYYNIKEGIGTHKPPQLYGAFPTDPYSHTPAGKGAQQPGMTGQVKEDILSRFGEFGVFVQEGRLSFNPRMLKRKEFLDNERVFHYFDIESKAKQLTIDKDSLCFTYCQVPVIYRIAEANRLMAVSVDEEVTSFDSHTLDKMTSEEIFKRTGKIDRVFVDIEVSILYV